MTKKIKVVALALALFMIVGIFSSCAGTTYVLTVGDKKVPSGVYLAMLVNAYAQAESKLTDEQKKTIWKQKIEKKDIKTYIEEQAYKASVDYVTTEKKFDELKLKLSEEDSSQIKQQVDYYWQNYETIYVKNGVGRTSYEKTVINQKKNELLFKKLYDKGGLKAVPDEDITKYYKENYLRYQDISIPLVDANGAAVAADVKTTLEKTANGYLERLNKGEAFNAVFDAEKLRANPTEAASSSASSAVTSQTAPEKADSIAAEKAKNVTLVNMDSTQLEATTLEGLKKLPLNKPSIFTDTKAIHVMIRLDNMEIPKNIEDNRLNVISKLKAEDYKKEIETWSKALKVTKNKMAISKYSPKNIDIAQQ